MKILDQSGRTLAQLSSIRIAGSVGPLGADFVATGGSELMELAMNPRNLLLSHEGKTYNCMIQNSNMASNAAGSGFAISGKVWPLEPQRG